MHTESCMRDALEMTSLLLCNKPHYVCLEGPVFLCRYSIHAKDHAELKEAVTRYPEAVEGAQGVFYCGYNSEQSFGGSAWLIQRESGNVLVDSPRFDPKLVKNIKVIRAHNPRTFLCTQIARCSLSGR